MTDSNQHFKLRRYGQPRLYNLTLWRWTISWRGRRLAVYRP